MNLMTLSVKLVESFLYSEWEGDYC